MTIVTLIDFQVFSNPDQIDPIRQRAASSKYVCTYTERKVREEG